MNEKTVIKIVREYLRSTYDSVSLSTSVGPDVVPIFVVRKEKGTTHIILGSKNGINGRIECKGSNADIDKAIGQCLRYSFESKESIYLAIPDDHKKLKILQDVINFFKLPIGLIVVDSKGVIMNPFG